MKASAFAETLERVWRAFEAEAGEKFPVEFMKLAKRSMILRHRAPEIVSELPDAHLADLFDRYETTDLEIGMVWFAGTSKKASGGWQIGTVEVDPIILDESTGYICAHDHAAPNHVMWTCARSGGSFLDALAYVAELMLNRAITPEKEIDERALQKCVTLANTPESEPFYRMLLYVYPED